jgi:hypothetical protein
MDRHRVRSWPLRYERAAPGGPGAATRATGCHRAGSGRAFAQPPFGPVTPLSDAERGPAVTKPVAAARVEWPARPR